MWIGFLKDWFRWKLNYYDGHIWIIEKESERKEEWSLRSAIIKKLKISLLKLEN